jgi:hypothetical protein
MSYSGSLSIVPEVSMKTAKAIRELGDNPPKIPGCPTGFCDFTINEDGEIEHNGNEKTRDEGEWIALIIQHHLEPKGHVVNGTIEIEDREYGGRMDIVVENNEVFIQDYAWVPTKKSRVIL